MASTSFLKYVWGKLWAKYPIWKKKLIVHTTVLWMLLAAHAIFLGWARRYDTNISSFWGAFGFDVLDTATDCSLLQQQQSAWALAINILATVITYVSSDVLLALSAPSRRQLDACHAAKRYMEVGVHSFHNIRSTHFDWRRRVLWAMLTLLVLPFHLLYVQPRGWTTTINEEQLQLHHHRLAASLGVVPNHGPRLHFPRH